MIGVFLVSITSGGPLQSVPRKEIVQYNRGFSASGTFESFGSLRQEMSAGWRRPPGRVQTIGMDDFETLLPGGTVFEQSLPPDWHDVVYRNLGSNARFVADVIELACRKGWIGSTRPEDMVLETTQTSGAGHEKGFNDIAWSTTLLPQWQDGMPERERIFVVIEVQSTVQPAMPFRVMQYEAMRYRRMQRGRRPVSRIQTIVLYTGEEPWDVSLDAGEVVVDPAGQKWPRVPYALVDLQRLEAEPGSKNLVVLLAGIVRGDTLESLTRAAESMAERLAELGDVTLEQDMFELVKAQGKETWPELDWKRCASLAELVRLLKEGKMTWPEKWKEQLRPEVEAKVRSELRPEIEAEVRSELRPEIEAEMRTELRPELKAEMRTELRPELKAELRSEIEAEVRSEIEAELRPKAEE